MRKFLSVILFFGLTAPAIADECPMGYMPTKYTQLEYIESTGTQYIDTGVVANATSEFRVAFKMMMTQLISSREQAILGCKNLSSNQGTTLFYSPNSKYISSWSGTQTGWADMAATDVNTIHEILMSFTRPSGRNFVIDGTTLTNSWSNNMLANNEHYAIFNSCANAGKVENFYGRIYYFNMYQDNELVFNGIPAKSNSDNELGMYDTVTGQFFTNAGTGEFIAGPETSTENTCFPCPPNTYKDFVGNSDCIPCPDTFSSPSGATSINECGRILHIGDYVAHMPFGRRTEHGLCTMFDGKKYCADVYEKQ
ncbi:MAG: hypothetical protein MJ170_04075 [Alphaproteobacteria bacterium]|nr:hypothetical protein [Alphaproteobacteria bacterium]